MAYTGAPVVRNRLLWLSNAADAIQLDSVDWFLWLQTATRFSYALGRPPYYSLTFRKENRRHQHYWYAYLKSDSKLHKAYVGRTSDLSTGRLNQVTQVLLDKLRHAQTKPAPDTNRPPTT